ncbi:DUF3592 domain-containing protein [Pseudofrankia asymbiotica]|uniref:DUF3592 domain-containing protein n=2 Tax=Pseudofrankia asymbiotica TaxID=1834516 RepID=A0A1V2IHK5_9ACTN|nr:DUF3592 domain-containing protein [Pseudofrankia asymbiotica]
MSVLATLVTISMVCVGALFLLLGIDTLRQIIQRIWLRFAGHTALATIVDCEVTESDAEDGGSIFTPIVDYTTRAGEQLRAVTLRSSDAAFLGIGAKIRVVYRPRDPTWVTRTDWFGAALSGIFLLPLYFTAGPFCLYFGIRMLTD